MEKLLLPKAVNDVVKAATAKSNVDRRSNVVTNELIKKVTDYARHHGPCAAARHFPNVSKTQASHWVQVFRKSNWKTYCTVQKRGRDTALSAAEEAEAEAWIDIARGKHEQVTSGIVSGAAQGIVIQRGAMRLKDYNPIPI